MPVYWTRKQGWTGSPGPEDYEREFRRLHTENEQLKEALLTGSELMQAALAHGLDLPKESLPGFEASVLSISAETVRLRGLLKRVRAVLVDAGI